VADKELHKAQRSLLILDKGPNPSTDYFVRPFAEHHYSHILRAKLSDEPSQQLIQLGTDIDVMVVRSINPQWLRFIQQHRSQFGKILFFFDDDVFSPLAWRGLPIGYAWRLAVQALRLNFGLKPLIDHYYVGSEGLRIRYRHLNPQVLMPSPVVAEASSKPIVLFYHATASHFAEKVWLAPIIQEILYANPDVHFEIIGGPKTKALYRHLPRVTVVHQMDWVTYQAFCQTHRRHIGLAPLLDRTFNAARSETKYFDIERCGASGIFSKVEPFATRLQGRKGVTLVENDPAQWVKAILHEISELKARNHEG